MRILPLAVLLLTTLGVSAAPDDASDGEKWWAHVKVLADDKLEGRNTGSLGYRHAADYVADQYLKLGLKPAGTKGFFQAVDFKARQIDESKSSLELYASDYTKPLSLADDANFGLPATVGDRIEARAVFVGHGLVIPEMNIDDLAGLDLKGKIAVILSGGPKEIPGPIKAHFSHARQQWDALKKKGAIGIAVIRNPKSSDIPWSRSTLARLQPVMSLAESSLDDTAGMKISLRINPASADKFLAGTGHTVQQLLDLADNNKPLPKFPLVAGIRAKIGVKRSNVTSMNVAGLMEGSDASLKKEYVVFTAHLDHLGIGQPINGDAIYNGAMDNASGVASMLEVARSFKQGGTRPKRSLLFVAVTGEEKGLQGSKFFANHPTVPKSAIVADLNNDMFLPIHPLKTVRVFGLDESTLGDQMQAVCSASGVAVQRDPEPDRNIFIRSDQYSFVRLGIPSLFFGFGFEPGTPEEQLHKDWLANRYHAPSDDLAQPVDKVAAAQFNHIMAKLAERVANDSARPAWKPESFFKRFAK
jgi:Zn-dependent M28 family amino/carboxypeptidase